MKRPKLKVELRDNTGKEVNKKLRKEGIVPGVLYSPHDKENSVLKVKNNELSKLLSAKSHGLIDLEIDDGKEKVNRLAVIKDVQYNWLKKQIIHVDFYGVTLKEKLTLEVDIELIGEPIGVKEGGILQVELRKVEIECLPSQVPDSFKADLSSLNVGDHIAVGDVEIPEGVEVLTDADRIIASVVLPTKIEEVVEEEEEVAEGEEAVEGEAKEEEKAETKEEPPSSAPKKE
ncbi:MAG: 50S ribosomal protein L25 [Candidatus Caldatribacteriota bacterium]|nr:50S ribosomal protein L25 [Candidatus Caldatribacteriota bacterium]